MALKLGIAPDGDILEQTVFVMKNYFVPIYLKVIRSVNSMNQSFLCFLKIEANKEKSNLISGSPRGRVGKSIHLPNVVIDRIRFKQSGNATIEVVSELMTCTATVVVFMRALRRTCLAFRGWKYARRIFRW